MLLSRAADPMRANHEPISVGDPAIETFNRLIDELYAEEAMRRITAAFGGASSMWGKKILLLGLGNGIFADELARRIGDIGYLVVAHRERPPFRASQNNMTVMWRDVLDPDKDIEDTGFDLICSQLAFDTCSYRDEAVPALLRKLQPGGTLIMNEWKVDSPIAPVLATRDPRWVEWTNQLMRFLTSCMIQIGGSDTTWAGRLHTEFKRYGMVDVTTDGHFSYWDGGSPGAQLLKLKLNEYRVRLEPGHLSRAQVLLDDPETLIRSFPMVSTMGRKAGGSERPEGRI